MTIVSLTFAVFFSLVAAAVRLVPPPHRWMVVLAASCAFLAVASQAALCVAAGVASATYWFGKVIAGTATVAARRRRLAAGVGAVVGLLVLARLQSLFAGGTASAPPSGTAGLLWALGLSFYGLKAIGYLIDVHHSRITPESSPWRLAAYLLLFLELHAGPVDRAGRLLPQLAHSSELGGNAVSGGLRLVLWGLVQKTLIGDRLAPFVAAVFAEPGQAPDALLVAGVLAFALQLYFDFSGYTDIAIGLGRTVGLVLPENFRQPYFARSISDFWLRWHASLSSWLRDYVFLPTYYSGARLLETKLGASPSLDKVAYGGAAIGTMALAGAWHGLQPGHIAWGLWFGVVMTASAATSRLRSRSVRRLGLKRHPRVHGALKSAVTMAVVLTGWTLLRAGSLADAAHILAAPLRMLGTGAAGAARTAASSAWSHERLSIMLAVVFASGALAVEWVRVNGGDPGRRFAALPAWVRWGAYYAAIGALLFMSRSGSAGFIYAGF